MYLVQNLRAIMHMGADGKAFSHAMATCDSDMTRRGVEPRPAGRLWGPNGRVGTPTRLCTLDINRICPHGRMDRGVGVVGGFNKLLS